METTLGADDSVDGRAVVLPSSTMRVVDGWLVWLLKE